MNFINRRCVTKLIDDPIGFAMIMDDEQLEHVIVTFVSVLNKRKTDRGG
jgi:hypothetical protein